LFKGDNEDNYEIDNCAKFRYVKVEKRESKSQSVKVDIIYDRKDEEEKKSPDLTIIEAMPLVEEGISLEPDMVFGWQPQVECTTPPIPLYFDFVEHPVGIYNFTNFYTNFGGKDVLVYQGYRPSDSY